MRKNVAAVGLFIAALITVFQLRQRELVFTRPAHPASHLVAAEQKESGPMEFIKFHLGIRTRSDESRPGYPANYQWQELQKAQATSALSKKAATTARTQSVANGVTGYTERGPGNVPGRTRGLIVDPDDATNRTWYAGSASGGVWKTTNAGTSWQWLTSGIPNLSTTTLAMDSSNHNIIYAGTGEGFGLVDGVNGTGIFKSTDRGNSWTLMPNSVPLGNINRLTIDPRNGNNVLAAANSGIYKSTDGGSTWNKVFSGVVQDLRPTPNNFAVLYASQYGVGVLKSLDRGTTWSLSNVGMSPAGRLEIAVSPVNTQRLVASAEGALSGTNSDLYFSPDAGATWYLVALSLSSKTVDYLGSQGWYDNTVAFSPFNQNVVYVGGIGTYQVTLGSPAVTSAGSYSLQQNSTASFMSLVNFGASAAGGLLSVGGSAGQDSVKVLFGPGISQKAHRFLVPTGATSGVADTSYTYQDYVDVPFQVWDVTKKQQLMVSFRDQDRNGVFDLILSNTTSATATAQSREYVFISTVPYNATTPSASIATKGGQVFSNMYFYWPLLAAGATWTPTALPSSNLLMTYQSVKKYSSTVLSCVDPYSDYDGKNTSVHPDQHNIYPMVVSKTSSTFQLLMANDGGLFLSGTSTSPGTTQGEWSKVGNGYNTSQFYGADKKPGAQEYLGGMQDNSTYFTPSGSVSTAATYFSTNSQLAGDGFEALWHSLDKNKMIGGSQYNYFSRSLDGGATWASAFSGLTLSGTSPDNSKFPFISKLAGSKQAPDQIYTVGSEGVWKSTNFGGNWTLTPLTTGWGLTSFTDVEVSRANANIVWAGSGMSTSTNLFVSTNAGTTFTAVPNPAGFTLGNLSGLASHPTNPKVAYALFSFAKTAKILKTQDLGQTWTDISGFGTGTTSTNGFPDVAVYCLYVRPDNPNIIWAGTEIGIVESLDGGATWAMNTEFPAVAVWSMKGQDNEIVIATHGRGIWTAEVAVDQNANFPVPSVVTSGTSPESKFLVQVQLPSLYDSVQVVINGQTAKFVPTVTGVQNVVLTNAPKGAVTIQLVGYKAGAPIYSTTASGTNFTLLGVQQQYFDYFISAANYFLNGLSLQSFGASNSSLQTSHNYATNADASATLLVPVVVSSGSNTSVSYQDVAIVVPGSNGSTFGQTAFNDYVVVEGTKDGITWIPLGNGYNASANATWLNAYTSSQSGTPAMTVTETFDLKNKFSAGDTLLIRFRLHANIEAVAAWGWSVDNLYIQQTPTAVEPAAPAGLALYPNPSSGKFTATVNLSQEAPVAITVWDMAGRTITQQNLGLYGTGLHPFELNLESSNDGIYLVKVQAGDHEQTQRILIRR